MRRCAAYNGPHSTVQLNRRHFVNSNGHHAAMAAAVRPPLTAVTTRSESHHPAARACDHRLPKLAPQQTDVRETAANGAGGLNEDR
jgi:hypothetical protein